MFQPDGLVIINTAVHKSDWNTKHPFVFQLPSTPAGLLEGTDRCVVFFSGLDSPQHWRRYTKLQTGSCLLLRVSRFNCRPKYSPSFPSSLYLSATKSTFFLAQPPPLKPQSHTSVPADKISPAVSMSVLIISRSLLKSISLSVLHF